MVNKEQQEKTVSEDYQEKTAIMELQG